MACCAPMVHHKRTTRSKDDCGQDCPGQPVNNDLVLRSLLLVSHVNVCSLKSPVVGSTLARFVYTQGLGKGYENRPYGVDSFPKG